MKQICSLFMCSFSSLDLYLSEAHTCIACAHTRAHANTVECTSFVSGTLWNVPVFWEHCFSFQRPSALGSACLFFPWEDAPTFRSTMPLKSLEGTFFSPIKEDGGWRGQFWVAVLSGTEGLKETELEVLKNLEHLEMSHSHREDHTLGNFLPWLTIKIQK